MTDQTAPQRLPAGAPGSGQLDLQAAVNYVTEHREDDERIGKALRRVANEGTPGEIAGFAAALVALIREAK